MAKHSKNTPFFSKKMRILSGSAIFADIAVASGGIWNTSELEKLLDDDLDRAGFTGMYRKMPTGVIPTEKTCFHIESQQENTNPFYWRDLPLWILLSKHLIKTDKYNQILDESCSLDDELYLIDNNEFLETEGCIFKEYTWFGVARTRDPQFESVESLIRYTARLRRAIDLDILPLIYRYSIVTHYILEKQITKVPQLYIRWPLLLEIYRDQLWPMDIAKLSLARELNITLRVMNMPQVDPAKYSNHFTPKKMLRRMNLQYLNNIYAQ